VHGNSRTKYSRNLLLYFFFPRDLIPFISFKYKRAPVFAIFAKINLADISPGNGKNITAFTDRTIQHVHQLYMNNRYKN